MIHIKTDHPIAEYSTDHTHPNGIWHDNRVNFNYVTEIEEYFNFQQIAYLDLGCAGGALVCELLKRGHTAVGLDGSDHCITADAKLIEKFRTPPQGYDNWKKLYGVNLFTCDVSKEYNIYQDDTLLQFDIISAWDVMEHFNPEAIDTVSKQIHKHLKPGGIFVASINQSPCGHQDDDTVEYHKSLFTKEEWEYQLNIHFTQIQYPFHFYNRDTTNTATSESPFGNNLMYAGKRVS